eukprot:16195015-Heterocapsa_arctica.AAC.1
MAGGHQGVHQRVGRFVVPSFEKSPVVDVGPQICRFHSLFPGNHMPVELGVAGVDASSPALVL